MGSNQAIEGIIGVWQHGISVTLLFEKYQQAFSVGGLNWYFVAGGHAAIMSRNSYYDPYLQDIENIQMTRRIRCGRHHGC